MGDRVVIEMEKKQNQTETDSLLQGNTENNHTIEIHRPAYTQEQFDTTFGKSTELPKSLKDNLVSKCKESLVCNRNCLATKLSGIFPFVAIMREYEWKKWLLSDVIAGLSVGVIHIPQSMGFALLSSLPPIYGLYSSIYPLLIYFFFGTSRHISLGTMAVVSIMIGAVVEREAANFKPTEIPELEPNNTELFIGTNESDYMDSVSTSHDEELTEFKVGIATSLTLLVGLVQLVMYVLNQGVIASFMSMSFIGGFMTGAAFHIFTSQVPFMLGIKPPRQSGAFRLPKTWYWIFRMSGETNVVELGIAAICIIILFILKEIINEKYKNKLKIPIPAELIIVAIGILVSYFANLNHHFGVRIISHVPTGLPAPKVPTMYKAHTYISDAFAIAMVSYAVSMSLAKVFAQKFRYNIDQNQELLAHGLVHFISSFFFCFAGSQAPPRTIVNVNTGGKTQVASLISMLMVLLVCLFMGPIIEPLPNSVLAAVITVAIFPLFKQFADLPTFFRINSPDCIAWIITFLAVVILDVDLGMYIGIGISLLIFINQTKAASGSTLSPAGKTELFFSTDKFPDSLETKSNSIKIFKFDSPLYFATVDNFKSKLFAKTLNPNALPTVDNHKTTDVSTPLKNGTGGNTAGIVLDCSVMFYIDLMGLNFLKQLMLLYNDKGIRLVFANCNQDFIKKMELNGSDCSDCCFPSNQDAVAFLQSHP